MKIIARCRVELDGHIYSKGEPCEFDGVVTPRVAANFVGADGGRLAVAGAADARPADGNPAGPADDAKAKVAKAVSVMGRRGVMQSLEAMGITFSPNAKTDYLAKLMLMNKGEIVETE